MVRLVFISNKYLTQIIKVQVETGKIGASQNKAFRKTLLERIPQNQHLKMKFGGLRKVDDNIKKDL